MLDFFVKHAIGTIVGAISMGLFTASIAYYKSSKDTIKHLKKVCEIYEKSEEEQTQIAESMQEVLRYMITNAYYDHMKKGHIREYALTNILNMYERYKYWGGNGAVSTLIEELKKLKHL